MLDDCSGEGSSSRFNTAGAAGWAVAWATGYLDIRLKQ